MNLIMVLHGFRYSGFGIVCFMLFLMVAPVCNYISIIVDDRGISMKTLFGRVLQKKQFPDVKECLLYNYGIYMHSAGTDIINSWCIFSNRIIDEKYRPQYCHISVLATLSHLNFWSSFNPKGFGEANDAYLLFIRPIFLEEPTEFVAMFGQKAYDTSIVLNEMYNSRNIVKAWFMTNVYVRRLYRQIYAYISSDIMAVGLRFSSDRESLKAMIPVDVNIITVERIYKQSICKKINRFTLRRESSVYKFICNKDVILFIGWVLIELCLIVCDASLH